MLFQGPFGVSESCYLRPSQLCSFVPQSILPFFHFDFFCVCVCTCTGTLCTLVEVRGQPMLLLEVSKLMRSCPCPCCGPSLTFSLCHPPVLLRSSEAELMPLLGAGCLNAIPISQGKYPDGRGPIPTPPGGEPPQSCGPHDPTRQDQVPSTGYAYAMQSCGGSLAAERDSGSMG